MEKTKQSSALLACILGLAMSTSTFAAEKLGTVSIKLPKETAQLRPGPGLATAEKNCTTCHSVDYIYMQPPLSKEQWHAEVVKMRKAYGASIQEGDVGAIVNYLTSQNGKPQ